MQKKKYVIISIITFACLAMGVIDAIIMPGYIIKSISKVVLFLSLALSYFALSKETNMLKRILKPNKRGLLISFGLGFSLLILMLGLFFICRNIFDFSHFATNIRDSAGVNKDNFLVVTIYICLINSFLEEFFFRGFAFLTLKNFTSRKTSYVVSAMFFALYHVAMMIGGSTIILMLSLIGLFGGGLIFNFINEKYNNIYMSWIVHVFANIALNTVGYILM